MLLSELAQELTPLLDTECRASPDLVLQHGAINLDNCTEVVRSEGAVPSRAPAAGRPQ
jgi:hypothetical protein